MERKAQLAGPGFEAMENPGGSVIG